MPDPPQLAPAPGSLSELLRALCRPAAPVGMDWDLALRPGAVIGRFELVREMGRGGFGVVYEAHDRELGRTVAFKAVRAGDRAALHEERLLREAEAVARLSHPNIVTLYDVGHTEHGPYLVLEYLSGQTLGQRLAQGPLPLLETLRVGAEVAKGLAHAHAQGVVHRDLSPGNVFLCDDGQVKILDLGLAHAFGWRRTEGGTPGYMAPEQWRGAPEDERTDVFALGVLLYRMLAHELPFPAASGPAGAAPRIDVPQAPALGELVGRALEPDPVRRPRDAGELCSALGAMHRELERAPSSNVPPRIRRGRRIGLAAAVLAALIAGLAGVAITRVVDRRRTSVTASVGPSIAVLPFADLSPGRDQEFFSDGLADEILNALAGVEGLRVPSRTSSFSFKGKNATLGDIARELKVTAVLEGSVRTAGRRVRVTAQLVDVADGYRRWGQTYESDLTDIFEIQQAVARSVVRALGSRETGAVPGVARATEDVDAYRAFLLGRHHSLRFTTQNLRLAAEAYQQALALDPGYSAAWAGLAWVLFHLGDQAPSFEAAAAERQRALEAAQRAVTLAPRLVDGLSTRGLLRAVVSWDWGGAKSDLELALAINPNDSDAHRRYSTLLACLGKLEEAVGEARKAADLDPLGGSWAKVGHLLQMSGKLDQAEAAFRRDLESWPDAVPALVGLGRNLLLQSRSKEALALFGPSADPVYRLWMTAIAEEQLGHTADSRRALESLVGNHAHTNAYDIAEVYAWLGEKELAFQWLERAHQRREGGMVGMFRADPFLSRLRGDPRYAALLDRMKLPAQ